MTTRKSCSLTFDPIPPNNVDDGSRDRVFVFLCFCACTKAKILVTPCALCVHCDILGCAVMGQLYMPIWDPVYVLLTGVDQEAAILKRLSYWRCAVQVRGVKRWADKYLQTKITPIARVNISLNSSPPARIVRRDRRHRGFLRPTRSSELELLPLSIAEPTDDSSSDSESSSSEAEDNNDACEDNSEIDWWWTGRIPD